MNTTLALSGAVLFPGGIPGRQKPKGFLADIGVCTSVTNSELLAGFGYSYIEENVQQFLVPEKSEEEFNGLLKIARNAKIPVTVCNSFLPGTYKCVGPDAVPGKILEYAETAFRRAGISGVKIIVFGSGRARQIPDGFPVEDARLQFINLCSQMAPVAAKYGVTLVIEPLNKKECNFLTSVSEGGEIVKDVNHPNVRLLADIYHMKMDDEDPGSILNYGSLIRHTHIAEKEGRAAPGKHGEDFREYFEALKKIKYKGRISVECHWEDMNSQAMTAINTIKKQAL